MCTATALNCANDLLFADNQDDGRHREEACEVGILVVDSKMAGIGLLGLVVIHLKNLDPENRVQSITYCPDTYRITTADGQTQEFWERNLRFKTDSSAIGPNKDVPVLFGAGMQGDRASVIFSAPEEISSFIMRQCFDASATARVASCAVARTVMSIEALSGENVMTR
jgi:hypothetical protein